MPICSRDDCAGNADQPWVDYWRASSGSTEGVSTFGRVRRALPSAALGGASAAMGETSKGQSFAWDANLPGHVTKKECGRAPQL